MQGRDGISSGRKAVDARPCSIAVGSNEFGAEQRAVALEGRLSLKDFVLWSEGESFDEVTASLAGQGNPRRPLCASVTRGSATFGSFATGLTSLFSTEMGFASVVIGGFIGNWIEISGRVDAAGGIVAFGEHTVRASHETAYGRSRLDLRQQAVNAFIAFDTGVAGSVDQFMSVSGPLASPSLCFSRNRILPMRNWIGLEIRSRIKLDKCQEASSDFRQKRIVQDCR